MLSGVARGLSNRAIADELGIAERTARTHVSNILAKLGLTSRTQAALFAVEHGLVRARVVPGRAAARRAVSLDRGSGPADRLPVSGPPGAPTIVFVHGTRLTGALWAPAGGRPVRRVPDDRPRPARPRDAADEPFTLDGAADAPGGARSTPTPRGRRAIVVGLSLGGYVAMALAARSPELVRGLVLAGRDGRADRRPDAAVPRRSRRS